MLTFNQAAVSAETNAVQNRIMREAGVTGPEDPMLRRILMSSLDFAYHAEMFFPDPANPTKPLRLEDWQKKELYYAQWGENFDKNRMTFRKPIAINSPRGFGKSVFAAVTADEFAIHFPYTKLALFSTSQEQANDIMEKVKHFIKHSIYAFMINKKMDSKTQLGLSNGSIIKAFPQSEVTIRGYHPHIKIVDEKARIKREILESAIRPMGRKVCWLEIGISTPFGMANNHYEDCTNPEIFHVKLLKPTDVTWVDEEKLAREVKMMGDRIARQELYAEFLADADVVFTPALIETMLHLKLEPKEHGERYNKYIMGIDYGKHRDYTVICLLHREKNNQIHVDYMERWRHLDYKLANRRAKELCDKFDVSLVVPDGTGVGISIMEDLMDQIRTPIYRTKLKKKDDHGKDQYRIGFIFTNISKLNIVDETMVAMRNSYLKCPHHFNTTDPQNERYIFKVLENEMLQFRYERTQAGNIIFSAPDDGKSHDDTLCALMLAVWGLRFGAVITPAFGGAENYRVSAPDRLQTRTFGANQRRFEQ